MPYTINNTQFWPQVIPDATEDKAGVMSAADKKKLDGINSATNVLIYADSVNGNDANPGTLAEPVQTFGQAWSLVPVSWEAQCKIFFAPGTYPLPSNPQLSAGQKAGGASTPLVLIGHSTEVQALTSTAAGSTSVVTDAGAGLVVNALVGAAISCTSGANAGQRRLVRKNTATDVSLNDNFFSPIGVGDTFSVERPDVIFDATGAAVGFINTSFGLKDVAFKFGGGRINFGDCIVGATENVEWDLSVAGSTSNIFTTFILANSDSAGAWALDGVDDPFSFIRIPCGMYLHGGLSGGSNVTLLDSGGLKQACIVCNDVSIILNSLASCYISSFSGLNSTLAVNNNAVWFDIPIFFGIAASYDNTPVNVNAAQFVTIFSSLDNSSTDAVFARNRGIIALVFAGGSGNTGYGMSVQNGSGGYTLFTSTTGAAGDTLVGATPKAYGALPFSEVDASGPTLNRIEGIL